MRKYVPIFAGMHASRQAGRQACVYGLPLFAGLCLFCDFCPSIQILLYGGFRKIGDPNIVP